jgi:hypothetical protein
MARPDYRDYLEVDEATVEGFMKQMRQRYGGR